MKVASRVPDHIKTLFRSDFEKGMKEYYVYRKGNIMAFQRELAAYLAQFRPAPGNVYEQLIQRLRGERVVYSTLNYDLLFELAAAGLGLNTAYDRQNQRGDLCLLKIHGSCNFWPYLPGNVFRGLNIEGTGNGAAVEAPVRPLGYEETLRRCNEDDSFAPAIAMYAEGKAVKICPEYILKIQSEWESVVAEAQQIYVIGVRVNASDSHIWAPLGRTAAALTYFGLKGNEQDFGVWRDEIQKRNASFSEATFSNAIDRIRPSHKKKA